MDNTTLDKPYVRNMELAPLERQAPPGGAGHQPAHLLTSLWTGGNALVPCDFRIYGRPLSGLTKNDHFRRMLELAQGRGFQPRYVLFDSWYASLGHLKAIQAKGWFWLSQLRSNRLVNPGGQGNVGLGTVEVSEEGRQVHLRGYAYIRVIRTVSKVGQSPRTEAWHTGQLTI